MGEEVTKRTISRRKIIFAVVLVVCLGVSLTVGLVLHFQNAETDTGAQGITTQEPNTRPVKRNDVIVDCHPEPDVAQEACASRGCTLMLSAEQGAPSCLFPRDYGYHMVRSPQTTPLGMRVELSRSQHPVYLNRSQEYQNLYLDVEFHSDKTIRLRFYPVNESRWEIPKTLLNIQPPNQAAEENSRVYNVSFVTEPVFGIQIRRRSSGALVFDSSLPGMIYSNQFLQLSTRLPSDYIYGFGEHNHRRFRHDLNWKTWSIFTRDVGPIDAWNLYGAHPVYMNVEENGTANMVFLKNSNAMEVALQPSPYPGITFRTIGGVLDFYVFLGDSPGNAVQLYTKAVGRPVMPPYWSLGFHLCRWGYVNITDLQMVIDRNRAAGIPYDGQWADLEYMYNKFVFSYDREGFAGLPALVDDLHAHHQKFVIIVDPGIGVDQTVNENITTNSPGYAMFDDGKKMGIFVKNPDNDEPIIAEVWPGNTSFPDFTHPNTSVYWEKWARFFYESEGVHYDALWIDMNEPASFIPGSVYGCGKNLLNYPPYTPNILGRGEDGRMYDKTLCMDSRQYLGNHYDLHSLYAHTEAIHTYNILKNIFPGKRPWTMTRASFAGSGKYATKWMGDNQANWENMKWSIIGVLEFGLFGFSLNGADICGFWYEAEYEMCIRWHQLGAFYPFARNHNGRGDAPVIFKHQDPAAWDNRFIDIVKEALFTRYRLLPYFYTLLHLAHVQGDTVMRSLMFEFPRDLEAREVDDQFLIGPALLVSPVLNQGQTTVHAYFPKARWYDYFNGNEEMVQGERKDLYTPLYKFNLHVRGGNIVPWQVPAITTYESRQNPFGVIVALSDDGVAHGELFWDDGESIETQERRNNLQVMFKMNKSGELIIRPIVNGSTAVPPKLDTIEIYGLWYIPYQAIVDGKTVYSISKDNQIVKITSLALDITTAHNITWTLF